MTDPFSVAGSAVGIISLGISVCQGITKYYSAFTGQNNDVDDMVGKVERLTKLLETLQHRLTKPRYGHSVSVKNIEQNIVSCAAALRNLSRILSKCEQESTAEDVRDRFKVITRKMLYPFKQKTLLDLIASVSQCQRDLATAMQILQIDQLSTVEISNAAILDTTTFIRGIVESHSHEVIGMREDIQRLMKVAVPALVLPSIKSGLHGESGNTTATVLDLSSASKKSQTSEERKIMRQEYYLSPCRCRPRTKVVEHRLEFGPITLIHTRKSSAEHDEECKYFVSKCQDEGAGIRFAIGPKSRRWNIMAVLNYNHAVGAFAINPTLVFKATVPDDHTLFKVTKDIIRGRMEFEAGLQSIRLLFQNGEAAPTDVGEHGLNVLQVALRHVAGMIEHNIAIDGAFQERARQLIMEFLALGTNVNERVKGCHTLDLCLLALFMSSPFSGEYSFLNGLRKTIALHRDCDYDPAGFSMYFANHYLLPEESQSVLEALQNDEHLATELGLNNLCLAVLRKSLRDVERILSQSPSEMSSSTPFKHTVLHLAADWPIGMATLLSSGGRSLVHMWDWAEKSPLEYACHYNCVSVVKLLLQADSRIDLQLLRQLEEQSKWELFQIFVKELSRRRGVLRQRAETQLSAEKYLDLGVSVEHPMNDIQTVLVIAEMEENFIQIPEASDYYGTTEISKYHCVNVFGSSFGNTVKGAEIVHNAGFLLELNVPRVREFQIRGQCVHLYRELWPWKSTLSQRLDKMLWLMERGFTFSECDAHHLFSPSSKELSLEAESKDLIASYGERIELLSHFLSSRPGIPHECPCCIDVCFPTLASLRTEKEIPGHNIKNTERGIIIFADLVSLLESCKADFGSQFWVWAMPRLTHSVLFEACRLTHSSYCCRRSQWIGEDDVKERQEEERYMRSRLGTLTEELTAEYEESNMLLADFLRDHVVIKARGLADGEETASPEDRERLREIGVVLEE